ncbi:MAG: M20/M25/M40 family metallo-hydrolase [Thermoanaerobaculia bacterium]
MPIDPIALARQLIDIPSPTGAESDVAAFVESRVSALGFECRRQEVAPDRFNVLARTGAPPRVVLCSHLDTVPPFFSSREDETCIYGRGACDTKGIIAAMIAAGEKLIAHSVNEFAFLFVVGEETDSVGAKWANRELGDLGSEFLVVGEPTESKFVKASKGAFTCTVVFKGVSGHSAYPARGDSAVMKLVAAVAEIASLDWGSHPELGRATVNVGRIAGGEKANVIAGRAEADMIFRTVGSPREVQTRLEEILRRHDGEITFTHGNAPTFMNVPAGEAGAVVSFNTDVPHLPRFGAPFLFGPGSILDAHGPEERIEKKDLLSAVGTYEKLVIDLLAGKVEVHGSNR